MRSRWPRLLLGSSAAAVLAVVLGMVAGSPAAVAWFSARAVSDATQAIGAAALDPVAGLGAGYDGNGVAAVSWDVPMLRPEAAPTYTVTRAVDGEEGLIAPIVDGDTARVGFVDDLRVPIIGKTVTDISVSLGGEHACAVADGAAYCWGKSEFGALGAGAVTSSVLPVPVDSSGALAGRKVTAVSAGALHTCAIADGDVFCWGVGDLGDDDAEYSAVPVEVARGDMPAGVPVTAITAGLAHTCAIAGGAAYCWGYNLYGRLGLGYTSAEFVTIPRAVVTGEAWGGATVTALSAGAGHTCAVADARAYCWGRNLVGELGAGGSGYSAEPVATATSGVLAGRDIEVIAAGGEVSEPHTCAIDTEGIAYCWGANRQGQLGAGTVEDSDVPVQVDTTGVLAGVSLTGISAGEQYTCAYDLAGAAFCWGANGNGQLGDGTGPPSSSAVRVDTNGAVEGRTVTSITAGAAACVLADGAAFCWGKGAGGQLGNGSTMNSLTPVTVEGLGPKGCETDWLPVDTDMCAPGPNVDVSYSIDYSKAGWIPATPAVVDATWEGTP